MNDSFADIQVGDEVGFIVGWHNQYQIKTVTYVTAKYFDVDGTRFRKSDGWQAGVWSSHNLFAKRVDDKFRREMAEADAKERHRKLVHALSHKLHKLPLAALETIDKLVRRAEWFEQNPPPQNPDAYLDNLIDRNAEALGGLEDLGD